MTSPLFDDAIVGGGCAGLSLAVHLASCEPDRRIVVIEPRTEYTNDRTWCFWNLEAHPFEDAIAHQWTRWSARHLGNVHTHESARLKYCEIPAGSFYRSALEQIGNSPNVELRLGTSAGSIAEPDDSVTIETDDGSIRARRAHDSRPTQMNPEFLQHFVGFRIKSAKPCFDSSRAMLMDFDVPQELGIHFVYVLPYDEHQALVEATFLSPAPFDKAVYISALEGYLANRYGVYDFSVSYSEQGAIPMTAQTMPMRSSERVYRIGTAGGLVKPSTGYAFLAIQRWTKEFTKRLSREELPNPPEPRSSSSRYLDAVFLRVLDQHPDRAPELFARLFQRVEPDALVRFLNDRASVRDRLQVITAMPRSLFLKESWPLRHSPRRADHLRA